MKDAEGIKPENLSVVIALLCLCYYFYTTYLKDLPVGVAFGAVAAGFPSASLAAAVALAIGIGIQNLPEGTAVAMPLRRDGMSRRKSFLYGQFSGLVDLLQP